VAEQSIDRHMVLRRAAPMQPEKTDFAGRQITRKLRPCCIKGAWLVTVSWASFR